MDSTITVKEGYMHILEGGFFGKTAFRRRYFCLKTDVLNCSTLRWSLDKSDNIEFGVFLLTSNVTISKNEDVAGLVLKSKDVTITLKAESMEDASAWISAMYKEAKRPVAKYALSKHGAYLPNTPKSHDGIFTPNVKQQIGVLDVIIESEIIESEMNSVDFDEINLYESISSSPPLSEEIQRKHTSTNSMQLEMEALAALQSDTFRARFMSRCSSLGGDYDWSNSQWSSMSDVLTSMPDVLKFMEEDSELPPCPTSPCPDRGFSIGGGRFPELHDAPSCESPDVGEVVELADASSHGGSTLAPDIDPALLNTDFYRKWMLIRKGLNVVE